ncbi:DUF6084 family protein [Iamia sp.]|uniref:DUF6084 family protein n=1 Tax=Iamia sp. TaxID=2722710 RepID=UPI002C8BFB8F|nr:DUF6084 family protein [Iamia sp.]HXH56624.1 DUF6084 family protein [Iamia sp.]
MTAGLGFEVIGAQAEPYAAVPTIMLRLRITAAVDEPVHALALKCQVRIEPQLRTYAPDEEGRLYDIFGSIPQWGDSLRPFLWTHLSAMVTRFTGATEIDVPIECSYDMEVAGVRYLHALTAGDIPLILLFSGTAFGPGAGAGGGGFSARPVAWSDEATYRLPVRVWRDMMDLYFPNSGWLRLSRETLDDLTRFKGARALATWDQAIERLLKEAGEP